MSGKCLNSLLPTLLTKLHSESRHLEFSILSTNPNETAKMSSQPATMYLPSIAAHSQLVPSVQVTATVWLSFLYLSSTSNQSINPTDSLAEQGLRRSLRCDRRRSRASNPLRLRRPPPLQWLRANHPRLRLRRFPQGTNQEISESSQGRHRQCCRRMPPMARRVPEARVPIETSRRDVHPKIRPPPPNGIQRQWRRLVRRVEGAVHTKRGLS